MRRTIIAAVVATLAVVGAPSPAVAASHHHVVLGKKGLFKPGGAGWGTAHPTKIFNGGDPSGLVGSINWTDWTHSTAIGHGLTSAFKPGGGFYKKPVKIILKATDLGHCTAQGPHAYTQLRAKEQKKPGSSHYTKWFRWAGLKSICARKYVH
jgi:hypothetical protein